MRVEQRISANIAALRKTFAKTLESQVGFDVSSAMHFIFV
jgi:hypothetical protein